MINLGNILDSISKNIDRIKTIGLIVLIVFFSVSMIKNGYNTVLTAELTQKLTGLDIKNDLLRVDIVKRDSILLAKDNRISGLKDSLIISESKSIELQNDYSHLKAKYGHLSEKVNNTSTDSSYKFLTKVAYPYRGNLEYCFNSPQVKGIYLTFLENRSLLSMNDNLNKQNTLLSNQLNLKSSLVFTGELKMLEMADNRATLEQIVLNKEAAIILKDEQLKINKRKSFYQKAGLITGSLILGFLIGK